MTMRVFGRKLLDHNREEYDLNVDDIVFDIGGMEIAISLYRAKESGRLEIRANNGILVLLPRAANSVEIETRR